MKKLSLIVLVLIATLTLTGCKNQLSDKTKDENKTAKEEKNPVKTPENESLTIKGSDTLLQMVSNLIEQFSQKNPDTDLSVTGGGSGTGIAALLNGEIKIANSSRDIKEKELNEAKTNDINIYEYIVARDGLSVIVNPANPINELNLDQLSQMFKGEKTSWTDFNGNASQIVLYGRQNTSGTYEFFRDVVVRDDYSPTMRNMEGNQAIIDAVKTDKNGIGYVGIGYVLDENGTPKNDIKILKIAKNANSQTVSPLSKTVIEDGSYALTRPLYHYLSDIPKKDSITHKLLMFEASDTGIKIIESTGFFAPNQEDLKRNAELLNQIK